MGKGAGGWGKGLAEGGSGLRGAQGGGPGSAPSRWGRWVGETPKRERELGHGRAAAEAAPLYPSLHLSIPPSLPPQVLVLLQRAGRRPGEADQAAHPEHEQAEPSVRPGHDPLRADPARAPALGAHPPAAQLPGERERESRELPLPGWAPGTRGWGSSGDTATLCLLRWGDSLGLVGQLVCSCRLQGRDKSSDSQG